RRRRDQAPPPRERPQPVPRKAGLHLVVLREVRRHLIANMRLKARLQLAQRRYIRNRVLTRHSPEGVPSTAEASPSGPARSLPRSKFRINPIDLPALSCLWFNYSLTCKKGRKEGADGDGAPSWPVGPSVQATPRRRRERLAGRFQGPQARPLLLSEG